MGWNKRVLTKEDFYEFCDQQRIEVVELSLIEIQGYYAYYDGSPVIVLNRELPSVEWRKTAFHEVGHHILHSHDGRLYTPGSKSRCEFQADVVMSCAIIPLPIIQKLTTIEIMELLDVSEQDVAFRGTLYRRRGY